LVESVSSARQHRGRLAWSLFGLGQSQIRFNEIHSATMRRFLEILIVILLLPLLIPIAFLALTTWLVHGVLLNVLVWICWCTRGTNLLLVYSDSPVWHDYIEENLIPRLPESTIVLNWSQRRTWRWYSLPVMVLRYFGGTREFNPMIVAFRPFRWATTFRFFQAFKDYKHGKQQTLVSMERDLFAYLARTGIVTTK